MVTQSDREDTSSTMDGAVCVIDGDKGVRRSLSALLHTLPVRVVTCSSGEEFLERSEEGFPSLLITELALPGMTGFELLRRIHSLGVHLPVLGLTAEGGAEVVKEASEAGMLEVLEKPFVFWAVLHRVQEILNLPE